MLGATRLAALCKRLEACGRTISRPDITALLPLLKQECAVACTFIRARLAKRSQVKTGSLTRTPRVFCLDRAKSPINFLSSSPKR